MQQALLRPRHPGHHQAHQKTQQCAGPQAIQRHTRRCHRFAQSIPDMLSSRPSHQGQAHLKACKACREFQLGHVTGGPTRQQSHVSQCEAAGRRFEGTNPAGAAFWRWLGLDAAAAAHPSEPAMPGALPPAFPSAKVRARSKGEGQG